MSEPSSFRSSGSFSTMPNLYDFKSEKSEEIGPAELSEEQNLCDHEGYTRAVEKIIRARLEKIAISIETERVDMRNSVQDVIKIIQLFQKRNKIETPYCRLCQAAAYHYLRDDSHCVNILLEIIKEVGDVAFEDYDHSELLNYLFFNPLLSVIENLKKGSSKNLPVGDFMLHKA